MTHYGNQLDFVEGDYVYLIKNKEVYKDKQFKVIKIEIESGGSYHDGYTDVYYAYLENEITHIEQKYVVAYINIMCSIKEIYAINANQM
jgi:hypothetical protein